MDIFKRCKYFMPMSIGLLIIFLPVTLHLFSEAPNHTFDKIDVFKIVFNRYFDFFVVFLIFYLLTFNTDSLLFAFDNMSLVRIRAQL